MPKNQKSAPAAAAAPPADNDEVEKEDGGDKKSQKGKHNDGAADLEKVTDFVEEQEISAQDIQKVLNQTSQLCQLYFRRR
mgnify:FL=1